MTMDYYGSKLEWHWYKVIMVIHATIECGSRDDDHNTAEYQYDSRLRCQHDNTAKYSINMKQGSDVKHD